MRVNNTDFHKIDISTALMAEVGANTLQELDNPSSFSEVTSDEVTEAQFVRAMQNAIDDSGHFTGDNAVTVSIDVNGMLHMTAGGNNEIMLQESLSGGVTGTFVAESVNANVAEASNSIDLSGSANGGMNVSVNGKTAIDIEFNDLLADSSYVKDNNKVSASEIVNVLQTKMDANFTGDDAVTVGVDETGTLTFSVAGGLRTIAFAEVSSMSDTAAASTFVAGFINASGSLTIDNNDTTVNLDALGITSVVNDFDDVDLAVTVTVNTTRMNIDATEYMRAAASDTSAITQEEMVSGLQAMFDDHFSGDDAVTVTALGTGKLAFDVASSVYQHRGVHGHRVWISGTFATRYWVLNITTFVNDTTGNTFASSQLSQSLW